MVIEQHKREMTGAEYRKLPFLNYSACKDFDENRNKFYRKYILQEFIDDEEKSDSLIFGDVVHCLLLTPEEFDKRFAQLSVMDNPKPQMKAFADNLFKVTIEATSTDGIITRSMKSLAEEAFNLTAYNKQGERVAFKGKTLEDVLVRFPSEAESYYRTRRENHGKDVVTARMYENAEKTVSTLTRNFVTENIFNLKTNSDTRVEKELTITFEYRDHKLKSMCDLVVVMHKERKIYIYDFKSTGWDVGTFEYNIIKRKYYLQWAMYYQAVKSWAMENGYKNYEIVPMRFIVISSDTFENPLIYTTSQKDLEMGLNGFTRSGRIYKGLDKILEEIKWHEAFNIWNISYDDYQNNGVRKVSLIEEK